MAKENFHRQVFPTGEAREFEPDANGKWKLTRHVEAPGQPGRAIGKGTLMENVPPPWQAPRGGEGAQ
ncbi:MAG: hypothetical protein JKY94_01925 [Rhodobacteraceae bacterium]|nr:hypothetical protein [Paracoccaceae bacterium]